jgi:putative hydrolase of the HAD superfamily
VSHRDRHIRAVFFDLDNTLVDRDAAMAEWLATVVPSERVAPLVELDRGSYGPRATVFAEIGAAAGLSAAGARRRFFREMPKLVRLRPDADELLARMSVPAFVVTNGPSNVQRPKLVAAGLVGRIAGAVISGEVGVDKPAPAIFHLALKLAGCQASEAVMVGDHPENDVAGAQAAGMDAVMVRSRWFSPPAGVRAVDKLTELPW